MVDVGGGTGFCTQGIVQTVSPINVVLMDQSPHQLAKAKKKPDLKGVTIVEVRPQMPLLTQPFTQEYASVLLTLLALLTVEPKISAS